MSTTKYTPQPGTIAARAVAHLQSMPTGTVLSSAQLADALDLDEANCILPSLLPAVRHGVVCQGYQADNKRVILWSLGDGAQVAQLAQSRDVPLHAAPSTPPQTTTIAGLWPGSASQAPIVASPTLSAHKQGPSVTNKRKPNAAPTVYADTDTMCITDDPITGRTKTGAEKYGPLFAAMKLGQCIKCKPDDAPKVGNALRKWRDANKPEAIVRAVRHYPADNLGRVWLLAGAKAQVKRVA